MVLVVIFNFARQSSNAVKVRLKSLQYHYDTIRYSIFMCAQKLTRWPA